MGIRIRPFPERPSPLELRHNIMAKSPSKSSAGKDPPKSGGWYTVSPNGRHAGGAFRDANSGHFKSRVMSGKAFSSTSNRANTSIQEALKHAPVPRPSKK